MAVLLKGINVLARNTTIARRYPGGIAAFRRDAPAETFCSDGLLSRVGFAECTDARQFVSRLQRHAFALLRDGGFVDIAVVDEARGNQVECRWLEMGRHERGFAYAALRGSDPGRLVAVPTGWRLDSTSTGPSRREGHLLFLRRDGGSDVYLDRRTGSEVRLDAGSADPDRLIN